MTLPDPMDELNDLNADAIYTAMVEIRDYVESPEGQAAYRDLLDAKEKQVDHFRALAGSVGARAYMMPKFELPDAVRETIYPGERDSVDCGIQLARSILFGPPDLWEMFLRSGDQGDPIVTAVRRFMADRAQ